MTATKTAAQTEAADRLRQWLKPGDTVYCILRHVSASGMSRRIFCLSIKPAPDMPEGIDRRHMDRNVAIVLGLREKPRAEGVIIGGCGMDMGFEIVYRLGHALYGDVTAFRHQWL